MIFRVLKCEPFFYIVFSLMPSLKLHTQLWLDSEVEASLPQQLPIFLFFPSFPRLLMPGKIFQTFSDFCQNLPLRSREPLETHVCNFPHTSFPHASFLSYQLGLEMIFHSFHSSPSHSTLKPPPFFYLTLPSDILPALTLISLFFLFLFSRQLSR